MKIVFVRHGEPNYETDSLTETGRREAMLLSERIKDWNVTDFYVSPMGRAKETASFSLEKQGRTATELPFMREFSYWIEDDLTGRKGVPWDFVPSDWTSDENNFKPGDGFLKFKYISKNETINKEYYNVVSSFDRLLEKYGYKRDGYFYRNQNGEKRFLSSTLVEENVKINDSPDNGPLIVIFCHLGVTCLVLSHLLNIPFETLTHGFYLAPTSVTVVTTEERWDNEAYFRVLTMGDCYHLKSGGQRISPRGLFGTTFNG